MNTFTNEPIELSDLPTWEEIGFRPISDRYRNVVYINTVLSWVVMNAIAIAAVFVANDSQFTLPPTLLTMGIITLLIILYLIFNLVSLKRRGYAVRERDVLYRAGIFYHYTLIIPFRHIQHVKINEGIISRMFGLVAIELFTAGAGRNMRLAGLDKPDALVLQQHISERISTIKKKSPSSEQS